MPVVCPALDLESRMQLLKTASFNWQPPEQAAYKLLWEFCNSHALSKNDTAVKMTG